MRTTVDLDADVLQAAKELARREGRSMGSVLSDLARRTLLRPSQTQQGLRNGVPILPQRGEVVTSQHVQTLAEDE